MRLLSRRETCIGLKCSPRNLSIWFRAVPTIQPNQLRWRKRRTELRLVKKKVVRLVLIMSARVGRVVPQRQLPKRTAWGLRFWCIEALVKGVFVETVGTVVVMKLDRRLGAKAERMVARVAMTKANVGTETSFWSSSKFRVAWLMSQLSTAAFSWKTLALSLGIYDRYSKSHPWRMRITKEFYGFCIPPFSVW